MGQVDDGVNRKPVWWAVGLTCKRGVVGCAQVVESAESMAFGVAALVPQCSAAGPAEPTAGGLFRCLGRPPRPEPWPGPGRQPPA